MKKQELKIQEYNHLYREIHSNADKVAFAINLMFTVSIAIITYGVKNFEESSNLIFLTPLILIISLTFFIYSQINSTSRVAAYIKVFHEERDSGIYWESRMSKFKSFKELSDSKYARSLNYMIGGLGGVCYFSTILAYFKTGISSNYELGIAVSIGITTLIILTKALIHTNNAKYKYPSKYYEEWIKIKNEEKTAANNA